MCISTTSGHGIGFSGFVFCQRMKSLSMHATKWSCSPTAVNRVADMCETHGKYNERARVNRRKILDFQILTRPTRTHSMHLQ